MTSHDPQHPSLRTTPDLDPDLDPAVVAGWRVHDDLAEGQRWTTWYDVEPLARGPEPRPDWVVTSRGAVDTDLGILKTGKEADVFLLERADPLLPDQAVVLAAKRYRSTEHRTFHRAASYTEGRSMKRSRDQRAVKRGSTFGRQVAAAEWTVSEWAALKRLWSLGLPVPYPVQVDGTELLMEWISVDGEDGPETAPRLAQARPAPALLASYFDQLREAMATMTQHGLVHGDLSPYNILAAGDRLVVIDLPQVVDLVGNLHGMDYLLRDCTNVCRWFRARGLAVDEQELFADLLATAF
ncbi:serine protein kinase RIO [Nocardioides marmotae]|uniref:serine protein kinase RIO n=1 Tax=Nocardioides marmotae TaxID=2663857 RepID=UPI0012B520A4|nr:RIO1 family regulatory kinase/ATPase [Nocardioides marmotae]MBC9732245.1 serine/threonine protein kinase [Nocardioides marmotae]MTB83367.1 serine/threonine protein kinase [Nocardioides marmotae]